MTIVQLEYLLAVAYHGSFSTAADYCFVTQPSLSTQIKNLEEELGVILLNRNDKPITLTDTGKLVVAQARDAIASFNSISHKVNEMKNEVKGVFKLAVIPTIAPYLLHQFVPAFMEKYPEVTLSITEMYTSEIEKRLKQGDIDMGILAHGFTAPFEIVEEVLFNDRFYLYIAPDSKLMSMEDVHTADIDINSLVLLPDGHCLRTQIIDLCNAKNRKEDRISFNSGSLETIMRMIDRVGGATIIPQMAAVFVAKEKQNQLKPFSPIVNARREISLAVSRHFFKKSIYKAMKEEILKGHKTKL